VQCLVSSCDGLTGYMIAPYDSDNTLAVQKPPVGSSKPVHTPWPLDPSTLPESELVCAGLQMVRAILNAGWSALLTTLTLLFATNLSDALFSGVLGALQSGGGVLC
jgi:hypothetical protein